MCFNDAMSFGLDNRKAPRPKSAPAAVTAAGESAKAAKFSDSHGDFTIAELSDGYRRMVEETAEKIVAFKRTIADGAFDAVYQPIVDIRTRAVHHYEALARFHALGGEASPRRFWRRRRRRRLPVPPRFGRGLRQIDGVYVREALSVPNGKVYLASWRPCAGIWTAIRLPNSSKRRTWLVC